MNECPFFHYPQTLIYGPLTEEQSMSFQQIITCEIFSENIQLGLNKKQKQKLWTCIRLVGFRIFNTAFDSKVKMFTFSYHEAYKFYI